MVSMSTNPYESPRERGANKTGHKRGRIACCHVVWCLFFLLPSYSVALVNYFPNAVSLPLPTSNNVLNRVSISIGIPVDIVLLASLLGCGVATILAPTTPGRKIIVSLGWFPLIVIQLLSIGLVLVLLGNPL
jgi:hypothetical protein